ncbi:MAG: HPr family phosphocarrier protein [Sphingomonadales bacterium]
MDHQDKHSQRSADVEKNIRRQTVRIGNRRGLHARASAKFVKMATRFDAEVTVTKGDIIVCGTSIMGLMMLAAATNSQISIEAAGREAQNALRALVDLVEGNFGEE